MCKSRLALVALCVLLTSACQLATALPTPTFTSVPLESTDTPIPVGPTDTPPAQGSQVTGAVLLEDGRCCVGGVEGSTVDITAAFEARSPFGEVIEMRVANAGGGCRTEGEMGAFPWEPFVAEKTFAFAGIPINWIGYYVSVQYRDALGNLSPVYCDDISVEGMPRPPTAPTP